MALAGVNRGTGTTTSSTSFSISPSANISTGSVAILAISMDNSATGGDDPSSYFGVTDSLGNSWRRVRNSMIGGVGVSGGVSLSVYHCIVTTPIRTTDTISCTIGTAATMAYTLTEITAASGNIPQLVQDRVGSGTSTTPSLATSYNVQVGELTFGAVGIEYGSPSITPDSDTTNGSWSTHQTATTGTTTSGQAISTQYKVQTTAASTQTFNQTITSTDWANVVLVYRESPIACEHRGAASSTTGATTFTVTPTFTSRSGSTLALCLSHDNSGAAGAGGTTFNSVTDSKGNAWTRLQQTNSGTGQNTGIVASIWTCHLYQDFTSSDTITVTFTNTTTNKIAHLYEIIPADESHVAAVTQIQPAAATGTSTAPTSTTLRACGANEIVLGCMATKYGGGTLTVDTDTTNGNWSGQPFAINSVGTTTTGAAICTQVKNTNAAGSQTFNQTITSAPWSSVNIVFSAQPIAVDINSSNSSSTSTTTLTVTPSIPVPVGSTMVLLVGADNSAASGGAPFQQGSVTDSASNVWRFVIRNARTAGSVANDGAAVGVYYCQVTTALTTSSTVTLTLSPATVNKMALLYVLTTPPGYCAHPTQANSATGASTTPSVATSVTSEANEVVLAAMVAEQSAAITEDSDTTGGVWAYTEQLIVGSGTTGLEMHGNYKNTTSASTQTFNQTITSADWTSAIACFRRARLALQYQGRSSSTTANTTITISPRENFQPNSFALLGVITDNSASSGTTPLTATSVTDTDSNAWVQVLAQNRTAGNAANDGVSTAFYYAYLGSNPLTTSDTITVTLSATTTNKLLFLIEVFPALGYMVELAGKADSASGSGTTPSVTTAASIAVGEILVGLMGAEYGDGTMTMDTDTSNGIWYQSAAVNNVGTTTTGLEAAVQWKLATGAGTQTFNSTITSADWATLVLAFRAKSIFFPDPRPLFVVQT